MGKQQKELLVHDIKTRISEKEFQRLTSMLATTRYRNMTQLLRAIITNEPVITYTQDGTLGTVMEELVQLRRELNAVGNNLNQITRHLNSLKKDAGKGPLVGQAILTLSQLEGKIEKIYPLISQLALKWLQK
jgi:hypothetical protein